MGQVGLLKKKKKNTLRPFAEKSEKIKWNKFDSVKLATKTLKSYNVD